MVEWATSEREDGIARPLSEAVEGYLDFLLAHPNFLRLILREELSGASALHDVARSSKALEETFAAVRDLAGTRGLEQFDVGDVVLVFVSLTFFPASQTSTFMAALQRDLTDRATRRRHVALVVDRLLGLVMADGSSHADASRS